MFARTPVTTAILLTSLAVSGCSRATTTSQAESAGDGEKWVAELLAAEADHSRRSEQDLIGGLAAMFADDVVMPAGRDHARGRSAAVSALRANPANTGAKASWTPARVGVSGDGQYAFSYGYMKIDRADGTSSPAKYAAFWRRDADGWHVIAYKRAQRVDGPRTPAPWGHLVPTRVTSSPDRVAEYRDEVWRAEVAFSAAAQSGVGAAFKAFAASDGAHMGTPTDTSFRFGPAAIGAGFPPGVDTTAVTTWAPTEAIAAASGDLGLTIGYISSVPRRPAGAQADTVRYPYFSIWRRAAPGQPWRFVFD